MLSSLTRRRAQPKRFQYAPRFYDSAKDDQIKRRMRTERRRVRPKTKQPQFIAVALALLAALYLYVNLDTIVERAAALGTLFFGG